MVGLNVRIAEANEKFTDPKDFNLKDAGKFSTLKSYDDIPLWKKMTGMYKKISYIQGYQNKSCYIKKSDIKKACSSKPNDWKLFRQILVRNGELFLCRADFLERETQANLESEREKNKN